jgi:hypothetical protein
MGITWGNIENGRMGWNIALETLHVSVGYVLRAQAARASKHMSGNTAETWHVSMGDRFQGSCFKGMFHDT